MLEILHAIEKRKSQNIFSEIKNRAKVYAISKTANVCNVSRISIDVYEAKGMYNANKIDIQEAILRLSIKFTK